MRIAVIMAHILVVDDDETARLLVARALAKPHRSIQVAAHGQEALEQIAKTIPDLVITDVVMPKMNGWSLVRHLRTNHATAFVPVILMTSLASEHDRIRGFKLGADDFLTKPVSFEELELRVENVLHHSRTYSSKNALLGASLAGSIAQFGLATLLTVIELERKSGVLTLRNGERLGTIILNRGQVFSAQCDVASATQIEVMCELLSWTDGYFSFDERHVEVRDEVGMGTTALLLDAARRMDELVPVDIDD